MKDWQDDCSVCRYGGLVDGCALGSLGCGWMVDCWANWGVLIRVGLGVVGIAVEAVRGRVVVDVVNLITCTVVLIAGYCVGMLVLARGGLGVVWLILEATETTSV